MLIVCNIYFLLCSCDSEMKMDTVIIPDTWQKYEAKKSTHTCPNYDFYGMAFCQLYILSNSVCFLVVVDRFRTPEQFIALEQKERSFQQSIQDGSLYDLFLCDVVQRSYGCQDSKNLFKQFNCSFIQKLCLRNGSVKGLT